jgi:hypothetical protein
LTKPPAPRDKYFLRSLHQEIDFYDRQLAYLNNYMSFDTPSDRQQAEGKLIAKRLLLERTAKELAASGVEFDEAELPRSFRAGFVANQAHA